MGGERVGGGRRGRDAVRHISLSCRQEDSRVVYILIREDPALLSWEDQPVALKRTELTVLTVLSSRALVSSTTVLTTAMLVAGRWWIWSRRCNR